MDDFSPSNLPYKKCWIMDDLIIFLVILLTIINHYQPLLTIINHY